MESVQLLVFVFLFIGQGFALEDKGDNRTTPSTLELEYSQDDLDGKETVAARHGHPPGKTGCPFGHGTYPVFIADVEDSNRYFRCSHGSSNVFRCPTTLKFDPNVRGCVWFVREDEGMRAYISEPVRPQKVTIEPPCGSTAPPKPCGSTTKPTPAPCGCTPKPTAKPTPTPAPCGCTPEPTAKPTTKPATCGCTPKPTPKPTPSPCGCEPTPTPHLCGNTTAKPPPPPYVPSKPVLAPGPRPTPVAALPKCPLEKTKKPVYLPHPTDKRKFYECSWGTAFECSCSEGLWFHIGLQACGWPQESSATIVKVEFDCFAKIDVTTVLLPHSSDSHKFYKIHEAAAYECHCSVGQVFDAEKKSCVDFAVPVCPTDLEKWPVYLPHPDHRLFYECAKGRVNLFYCNTGTFFHPDKKQCIAATVNL